MWWRKEVADNKKYVLSLVQDEEGHRYCAASEVGACPAGAVFQTKPIVGSALRKIRGYGALRIRFKASAGLDFDFGAHGEWFTEQERADIHERGWDHVRWVTGQRPALPPK
jgi:hypothetical protein